MNAPLTLVIANKNYSSWSMRPWVLLRGRDIAFHERMLKFESPEWRGQIAKLSPSGLVPVLWEGAPGAGFATWDTLAIAERLHELLPDRGIWPADSQLRARARSAAAKRPYLFGEFCAADAFYAPVVTRLVTYGVELKGAAREYQQALLDSPGVKAWSADAVKETEFVAEDEPYAVPPR